MRRCLQCCFFSVTFCPRRIHTEIRTQPTVWGWGESTFWRSPPTDSPKHPSISLRMGHSLQALTVLGVSFDDQQWFLLDHLMHSHLVITDGRQDPWNPTHVFLISLDTLNSGLNKKRWQKVYLQNMPLSSGVWLAVFCPRFSAGVA